MCAIGLLMMASICLAHHDCECLSSRPTLRERSDRRGWRDHEGVSHYQTDTGSFCPDSFIEGPTLWVLPRIVWHRHGVPDARAFRAMGWRYSCLCQCVLLGN